MNKGDRFEIHFVWNNNYYYGKPCGLNEYGIIPRSAIEELKVSDSNKNSSDYLKKLETSRVEFDTNTIIGDLELINNDTTLLSNTNSKWKSIKSKTIYRNGIYLFKIKINSVSPNGHNSSMIGVCSPDVKGITFKQQNSWMYYCFNGHKYHNGENYSYGEQARKNYTIGMLVNLIKGTLSFYINGKSLGFAFTDLPKEVKLAFDLYYEYDEITLQVDSNDNTIKDNIQLTATMPIEKSQPMIGSSISRKSMRMSQSVSITKLAFETTTTDWIENGSITNLISSGSNTNIFQDDSTIDPIQNSGIDKGDQEEATVFQETFNLLSKDDSMQLNKENTKVTSSSGPIWQSIKGETVMNSGKYILNFRLSTERKGFRIAMMIGVSLPGYNRYYTQQNVWMYHCYDGAKSSNTVFSPYGKAITDDSQLQMIVDMDDHTVRYIIDNKDYGIAFENLPNDLVLIVNCYYKGETLEIDPGMHIIKATQNIEEKFNAKSIIGGDIQLSRNYLTIQSIDKNQWKSIKGTRELLTGKYKYKFKINNIANDCWIYSMIGVTHPDTKDLPSCLNEKSWMFNLRNCKFYNNGEIIQNDKFVNHQFWVNDIVTMYIDLFRGSISFKINDNESQVAFTNVSGPVVFAVDLFASNESISLIKFKEEKLKKSFENSILKKGLFVEYKNIGKIELSNDNKTIKSLGHDSYKSTWSHFEIKEGIITFKFKIDTVDLKGANHTMIGVSSRSDLGDINYLQESAWMYYCGNGDKFNNGENTKYGVKVKKNDILTLIVDMDKHTLSFELNSQNFGVAYRDLPDSLFLAFDLYSKDEAITFLDYELKYNKNQLPQCQQILDNTISTETIGRVFLKNMNTTIKSISNDGYNSVKGNQAMTKGIYFYKVKIDEVNSENYNHSMIGVCNYEKLSCINYFQEKAWMYYCGNGDKFNNGENAKYGDKVKKNDILTLIVDMDKRTLSFKLNSKNFGVAYSDLPDTLYLACDMYSKFEEITILELSQKN